MQRYSAGSEDESMYPPSSSSSSDEDEEDETAWRAHVGNEEDDCGPALDSRVEGAFVALNEAIAANNEAESLAAAAQRTLEKQREVQAQQLAPLERRHAKNLAKLTAFEEAKASAHTVAARLRRLSCELGQAREMLALAEEALEDQRSGLPGAERAKSVYLESERYLETRRAEAANEARRLSLERRHCASEMERQTRRVIKRSAGLSKVAASALPYLMREEEAKAQECTLKAEVASHSREVEAAKAGVRLAMERLEQISLDIQQQQQEQVQQHHQQQEETGVEEERQPQQQKQQEQEQLASFS